jgi:transposase
MINAIFRCCAGIDVHREMLVCTLLKEESESGIRKETREYSTFRCDLSALSEWLCSEGAELVSMESTGVYWKAVYEELEEHGLEACVVNARHIKNVPGRKTDVRDSEWLAELTRCGLLRASFVPPRDIREIRLLTRYRWKLSGCLAGEKNRLHKVLDDCGIKLGCVVSDIDGVSAKRMIDALIAGDRSPEEIAELALGRLRRKEKDICLSLDGRISDRHRFLLNEISSHIEWLESELKEIDEQIVTAMKPYEAEWELLQTIPGIDEKSAAMLLAEIGTDMNRFGSRERLSSWAGMCPGNNESAGKKKSGRIRKGNRYVRQLLCEAANSARMTKSQFGGYYKGLVIRRGHKRSIVAVGHKLLETIYILLKKKEPYRDKGIDYEKLTVGRNASRWLKSLQKFGYLPLSCK